MPSTVMSSALVLSVVYLLELEAPVWRMILERS